MENIGDLIRMVTRGFYDVRSVLIMDALLIHKVLTDDDMKQMLDIQQKEIRGLCSKLKDDHLLKDHIQKEEGNTYRPVTKTYYYIRYTEAVDAIKWKVHQTAKNLSDEITAEAYPQGYLCPQCGERYTSLDAVALANELGEFICSICGEILQEDDTSDESKANQAKQARLMSQLHPIIDTLRKIDDTFIQDNTFESSLSEARPPPTRVSQFSNGFNNGANGHFENNMNGLKNYGNNSTASLVAGNTNSSLHVSITSQTEAAAQEQLAQEARAKALAQNALPTWHVESTVGKSMYAGSDDIGPGATPNGDSTAATASVKEEKDAIRPISNARLNGPSAGDDADNINAYFAKLQQNQQEDEDEEEEDEEDDDDDAEFEDVVPEVTKTTNDDNDDDDDDDDDDDEEFEDV